MEEAALEGIPASLSASPAGLVDPPVITATRTLPLRGLEWEDFERLCLALACREGEPESCRLYGVAGQQQDGIDIYARLPSGRYRVYQCKRYRRLMPSDVRGSVDRFLNGGWPSNADSFVLCTSSAVSRTELLDEIERQTARLHATGHEFTVWDEESISLALSTDWELVTRFFGRAWAEHFCDRGGLAPELLRTGRVCRVDEVTWVQAGVRRPNEELDLEADGQVRFIERTCRRRLTERLQAATRDGLTLIVLSGESTAGKTRLAFEVVRETCGDAWFVAPVDARAARLACESGALTAFAGPVVLWLDDVERFVGLSGEGVTIGQLEQLRAARRPMIVLATRGGYGQRVVDGDTDRATALDSVVALADLELTLTRELDDDEMSAASAALPTAPRGAVRQGLGAFIVARDRLRARYVDARHGGFAGAGRADEGAAFVDALLTWRAAVNPGDPLEDVLARRSWERFRPNRGCHQPPDDAAWQAAKDWATFPEIPGNPLARWSDHGWEVTDLILPERPRPELDAHDLLPDLIEEWAAAAPFRALLVAYNAHQPSRETLPPRLAAPLERWYGRALKEDPSNHRVLGGLARLWEQIGRVAEARSLYQDALRADPQDRENWTNFALFSDRHDSPGDARQVYAEAVELAPNPAVLSNFAAFLDDHREPLAAERMYAAALRIDPTHPGTLANHLRHLVMQGRHADALEAWPRVLEAMRSNHDRASQVLHNAGQAGAGDAIREAFRDIADGPWAGSDILRRYAAYLVSLGNAEEAVAVLGRALQRDPEPHDAAVDLARLLDDDEAAEQLLAQAVAAEPRLRPEYVRFLVDRRRWDEADALIEGYLRVDRDNVSLHRLAGDVRRDRGDLVGSLREYDAALALDPGDRHSLADRANALMHLGAVDAALDAFERSAMAYPPDPDTLGNHALLLLQAGQPDASAEVFARALEAAPQHANNLANFALLHLRGGRREDASAAADRALAADPDNTNARTIAAWLRALEGRLESAHAAYADALRDEPRAAVRATINLIAPADEAEYALAEALFDAAVQRDLAVGIGFSHRAGALRRAGRIADLQKLYLLAQDRPAR